MAYEKLIKSKKEKKHGDEYTTGGYRYRWCTKCRMGVFPDAWWNHSQKH